MKDEQVTLEDLPSRDQWVGRNLRRATNAVFQNFTDKFGQYRIRPALYSALCAIERMPGSSGAELSEWMQVPRANMVLILRDLEKRKLIEREQGKSHGRAHSLSLSVAGQKLMPELHAAHLEHTQSINALMTEAERAFLLQILQRLWHSMPGGAELAED